IVKGAKRHKVALLFTATTFILLAAVLSHWSFKEHRSSGGQIETLAVLPFVNESGSPDLDYLSNGLSESLINSLSRLPNLAVKARSSVFRYKGKEIDPQQAASELSVQAIINGRVIQRGD